MELHYRSGDVSELDLKTQVNLAKDSYTKAVDKSSGNPSLTAMARFGLGLCEEELGNFTEAERLYQQIISNPDLEGTVSVSQAKQRLYTMADYKEKLVFKASPKPEPVPAAEPITPALDLGIPDVCESQADAFEEQSTDANLSTQ